VPKTPEITLVPPSLDLALYAGDGASFRLTATDDVGEAFPLIEGVVTAQIRQFRSDPEPLVDFAVDPSDAEDGVIVISLDGADTDALVVDREQFIGVWDLRYTTDATVTLVQGGVTCTKDVTRS